MTDADNKDVPSVYMCSVDANAGDSDSLAFGGLVLTESLEGKWNIVLRTELINKGFPVGEDVRTLNAYKNVCVDLISQLGLTGLTFQTAQPAFVPMSAHVTLEVNGRSMQEAFPGLAASAHRLADNKPLYCMTLDKSFDEIYEKR